MEPIIVAIAIAVGHLLVARSAINIEEKGILLGAVEIGRQDDVVVQVGAQRSSQRSEGLMSHPILTHALTQVGIVLEGFKQLACVHMKGVNRRCVGICKGADIILAVGAEGNTVPTRLVT